jgi:hypothetical protein
MKLRITTIISLILFSFILYPFYLTSALEFSFTMPSHDSEKPPQLKLDASFTSPPTSEDGAIGSWSVSGTWDPTIGFEGGIEENYAIPFGDTRITLGKTFTFDREGAQVSLSLGVNHQGNFLGLEVNPQGWEGEVRVQTGEEYAQARMSFTSTPQGRQIQFSVNGRQELFILGDTHVYAEYSLSPQDISLTLRGEREEEIAEQAEKIAQGLVEQAVGSNLSGGDAESEESKSSIPQGWFLTLSPQEQKLAIEIIRHKVGMYLATRGINVQEFKLTIGFGEATGEDGEPYTLVAIGLKRTQTGLPSPQGVPPDGKDLQSGGPSSGGDPSQEETADSADAYVFFIDVVHGDLEAHLGIDRSQGPRLDLSSGNWNVSITPQGWQFQFATREDSLDLGVSLGSDSSTTVTIGFPIDESRARLTFSYNPSQGLGVEFQGVNPNNTSVRVSWLPTTGMISAEYTIGQFYFKVNSNGGITVGFGPSSGDEG